MAVRRELVIDECPQRGGISGICGEQGGHGRIYEKRRPSHCSLRGDGEQPFSRRVTTPLNDRVMRDKTLWDRIMAQTLLPKWASAEEIAEWAYFLTAVNRSMTAQDLLIDNGEQAKAEFIW